MSELFAHPFSIAIPRRDKLGIDYFVRIHIPVRLSNGDYVLLPEAHATIEAVKKAIMVERGQTDQLRARIAELEADKRRLDWLDEKSNGATKWTSDDHHGGPARSRWLVGAAMLNKARPTLREAIDAAMQAMQPKITDYRVELWEDKPHYKPHFVHAEDCPGYCDYACNRKGFEEAERLAIDAAMQPTAQTDGQKGEGV